MECNCELFGGDKQMAVDDNIFAYQDLCSGTRLRSELNVSFMERSSFVPFDIPARRNERDGF